MNTIFIDILKEYESLTKTKKFKNNLFKYNISKDLLNDNAKKNFRLLIDYRYLTSKLPNGKIGLRDKIFKKKISSIFLPNDTVYLVFSNFYDENKNIKKYIIDMLNSNGVVNFEEVKEDNTLKENDIKYIDSFIEEKKINLNKLRILIALDNVEDYDNDKILQYISKYKFIDILRCNGIDKVANRKLLDKINLINKEYGTTIDIVQKRNIQMYNIYLIYSKIPKEYFVTHYILRKDCKYIDMFDVDKDILNKSYLEYEKSKYDLEIIFNRMDINIENYSKNKLGVLVSRK